MLNVTLYTRNGCHLCEQVKTDLDDLHDELEDDKNDSDKDGNHDSDPTMAS